MYSPPADRAAKKRMLDALDLAADRLAAIPVGPLVWGWFGRTVSRRADRPGGDSGWLRLVTVPADKAGGKTWGGNVTAQHAFGDLAGRRPALLGVHDWTDEGTAYRAELSVYIAEPMCSPTPELRTPLDLPDAWWAGLKQSLGEVQQASTNRVAVRQEWVDRSFPQFLDMAAPRLDAVEPAHGDLHWNNLTQHTPFLLDWEGWGLAPVGYDAANLHTYSLLEPAVAARIRAEFPVLDTPEGRTAEAVVVAELIQTTTRGDNLDLVHALRERAHVLRIQAQN